MDFRQLRYFVTLFEEGNVTRAARKLGVMQPALSMQIRKLEDEFETQLFQRTSRGMEPTPVSAEFYKRAVNIIAEARNATTFLQDSGNKILGELIVGVMPSISSSVLGSAVNDFTNQYPDVKLKILEAYSDSLTERLLSGGLDFAFINNRTKSDDLFYRTIYEDRLVLVKKFDPSEKSRTFRAEDLLSQRLVLPSGRQGMRQIIDGLLMRLPTFEPPSIEIDSLNAVLDLVCESDYASILPSLAIKKAADSKRISALTLVEPDFPHFIAVAYNHSYPPSVAGNLFIEILQKKARAMLAER